MKVYQLKTRVVAEPWSVNHKMDDVVVWDEDKAQGSPKVGDMIVTDLKDPSIVRLMTEERFREAYEPA